MNVEFLKFLVLAFLAGPWLLCAWFIHGHRRREKELRRRIDYLSTENDRLRTQAKAREGKK